LQDELVSLDLSCLHVERMDENEQCTDCRSPAARTGNPFSQSIWDEPPPIGGPRPPAPAGEPSAPSTRSASASSRGPTARARLAELFRPPYELIARLPWDEARAEGKESKKWLLVNLQDMSDFACQALNRDIWRDEAIKELVKESFVFLQYNKDDMTAQQYISFYFTNGSHENADNYPHVSIVDPRTGEQVKVFSGRPFPDAREFHAQLVEFLDRYSLAANSKNPVMKTKRPEQKVDVGRMTEEEMLELAIKNSMAATGGVAAGGAEQSSGDVLDPDALTKGENGNGIASGSGSTSRTASAAPASAPDPVVTASSAAQPSRFASISSSTPHVEPANDPASTTRIQIRHPDGRVIRRFNLNDPVERIYEWLKAEPLPGKEGKEFELKAMPQGHDLIEDLNKTVQEASLKNGTVMVEFVE
jgi:UBX domain-containing protein 7